MKKKTRRILSLVLVMVMVLGTLMEYGPMAIVSADDGLRDGPQVSDELEKIDLSNQLAWSGTTSGVGASAHAAFDGNENTRWCASDNSFPQTLTVDLGEVKDIGKINIMFEQEGDWEYTLRISEDSESWSDYDTNPADTRQQECSHEKSAQARYVSIEIISGGVDANGGTCWASIWEMSVFGTGENSEENFALNQPCTATTTVDNGASASAAFDGNYTTRYCASDASMPQQLMVDMGDTYDIGAIYLYFEQTSTWDYTLETSLDGVVWEVYANPGAQTLLDVTETKDVQARYVRLTVNSSTDGAWASLWEMEVYAYDNTENNVEDDNGAKITFRGGSLRIDYTDYVKTSLRFGYKITLPEGATLNSWSWEYTTVNPDKTLYCEGINKIVEEDGAIEANLVITGIPVSYYDLVLNAKMKIEYTLSDGTVCTLEETVVRERSVQEVAEKILASQESTEEEKTYATNILAQ